MSTRVRILVLLTLLGCSLKAKDVPLPPSFKICPKASPNFSACVRDSVEYLRPYFKTGDLGNGYKVVPIEPITLQDIHLELGRGFYFHMDNIRAYRISNFIIEQLQASPETLNAEFLFKIPNVRAFSDYKINIELGLLFLRAQGKVRGFIDEAKIKVKLETAPIYKNGVEYKKVKKIVVAVKIDNLVLKIDDLFKDKALNDLGEGLVNLNMPLFLPGIERSVEDSIAKIAFNTSGEITERIPFRQLLT